MKPKWHKKLNKKDLKHIRETTDTGSLKQFKVNFEFQEKYNMRCWECKNIADKLGIK